MIKDTTDVRNFFPYEAAIAADAEQILSYFIKRDIMNSLIHLDNHERGLNTRFSPITFAAERVLQHVWEKVYGVEVIKRGEYPTIDSMTQ